MMDVVTLPLSGNNNSVQVVCGAHTQHGAYIQGQMFAMPIGALVLATELE